MTPEQKKAHWAAMYAEEDALQAKEAAGRANKIKVGDTIGFKSDVEQYATVVKVIKRRHDYNGKMETFFEVKAPLDGFDGDYIGRDRFHTVHELDVFPE